MSALDVTRSALRNAVRACIVASGTVNFLGDYPHGGTELGEIASVALGVQDKVYYPQAWEFGMPADHGFREGQVWVVAVKLRQMQDADWRATVFGGTAPTNSAPLIPYINDQGMGYFRGYFVANSKSLLLSATDKSHDSVLCYSPLPKILPSPIDFGPDVPAIGSLVFTLGWNTTKGKAIMIAPVDKMVGAL